MLRRPVEPLSCWSCHGPWVGPPAPLSRIFLLLPVDCVLGRGPLECACECAHGLSPSAPCGVTQNVALPAEQFRWNFPGINYREHKIFCCTAAA